MPVSTLRSCPSTPAATTAHDTQTGIAIILIRILILSSLSLTSLPKLISSSHQIISPLSLLPCLHFPELRLAVLSARLRVAGVRSFLSQPRHRFSLSSRASENKSEKRSLCKRRHETRG